MFLVCSFLGKKMEKWGGEKMNKKILMLTIMLLVTPIIAMSPVKGSSSEDWTLIHDGRGVKAYPDLRE